MKRHKATSRRRGLTPAQKRRLRVCRAALIAFCAGFLALGAISAWEQNGGRVSIVSYMLKLKSFVGEDPLSLVEADVGLTLIGVASDGRVIGYTSDDPTLLASSRMIAALTNKGWKLLGDSGQGALTLSRSNPLYGEYSNMLVQCVAVGQGSSFVVELW